MERAKYITVLGLGTLAITTSRWQCAEPGTKRLSKTLNAGMRSEVTGCSPWCNANQGPKTQLLIERDEKDVTLMTE